ncbi:hypothetical protein GCM10009554_80480 [Kribbella koreensis]|uniref:Uncharacterized protein n=1 Tax=Kribbella koreensis TaxID=57909 RepID=A0ABN1RRY9_9ACTN
MPRAGRADHMCVPGQGMTDQDGIVPGRVQPTPGLISNHYSGQLFSGLQPQVTDLRELPPGHRISRPPTASNAVRIARPPRTGHLTWYVENLVIDVPPPGIDW